MKQKTLFFLLFAIVFSACTSSSNYTKLHQKFLPSGVEKSYLGMPKEEFLKIHTKAVELSGEKTKYDFRTIMTETPSEGNIENIVYYFDMDGNQPLYEYIIEYKEGIDVNEIAQSELSIPNNEEENWLFESGKGYKIKVWTFKQKIVIAGALKDTEWETEF